MKLSGNRSINSSMVTMLPIIRSQARRAMTSAFRGTMPCQPLIGNPNQLGTMGRDGNPTKSWLPPLLSLPVHSKMMRSLSNSFLLLGCKGGNSKLLWTARGSIGKNIICNASHTWNQVKRRHTKGTDSSFAKRMKSTGIPKEFLGTLVSCASFTHSTAIQIAVPKKTTKIKAVKACRRANSTTGG